tara:strand:- start:128 stop:385 length:258 start_codon:yes stop_codon:yes gene_type:complete
LQLVVVLVVQLLHLMELAATAAQAAAVGILEVPQAELVLAVKEMPVGLELLLHLQVVEVAAVQVQQVAQQQEALLETVAQAQQTA